MDRRAVFVGVFLFTLISTLLVGGVCLYVGQGIYRSVVYAVVTMWVTGIVSQLALQNLYHAVVRPIEDARLDDRVARAKVEVNLDEVEEIDQVLSLEKEMNRAAQKAVRGGKS